MHSFFDLNAFIRDAFSYNLDSRFCSPLLFNSILAISCLFYVHNEAFVDSVKPLSRGKHFIAEAKKLLSWDRPDAIISINNITRLQAIPLMALFEASRMRTAAAWYYSTLFFDCCLELDLPEMPDQSTCSPETWRLGQMAVSYALFLTDRLSLAYMTHSQKLLCSSPLYSIANLFPASIIAKRRATIGPCSVLTKLFSGEPTLSAMKPTNLSLSTTTYSRQNGHQPRQRPAILKFNTNTPDIDVVAAGDQGCWQGLGGLIRKLQAVVALDWDDSTMPELLALHWKLESWFELSSGRASSGSGDVESACTSSTAISFVDPSILSRRIDGET
jgi:hypothetical protein